MHMIYLAVWMGGINNRENVDIFGAAVARC